MIDGRFLQFLDRDEFCDAPPDTPLLASNSVQNEIEARKTHKKEDPPNHFILTKCKTVFNLGAARLNCIDDRWAISAVSRP